jgi:hypothetical protein
VIGSKFERVEQLINQPAQTALPGIAAQQHGKGSTPPAARPPLCCHKTGPDDFLKFR